MAALSSIIEGECTLYVAVLQLRGDIRSVAQGVAGASLPSFLRNFDVLLFESSIATGTKRLPQLACPTSLLDGEQNIVNAQLANTIEAQLRTTAETALRQSIPVRSVYLPLAQFERDQLTETTEVHLVIHTVERGVEMNQSAAVRQGASNVKQSTVTEQNGARFYSFDLVAESAAVASNGDESSSLGKQERAESGSVIHCERSTRFLVRVIENWLRERASERGFLALLFSPRCRSVSHVVHNPAYSNLFVSETIEQHAESRFLSAAEVEISTLASRFVQRRVTNAELYNRLASVDRCDRVVSNPAFGDVRLSEYVDQCDRFAANPRFANVVGLSYVERDRFDTDTMRPNFGAVSLRDESSMTTVFSWLREYASLDGDMYMQSESEGDLSVSLSSSIRAPQNATESSRSSGRFEMLPIHVCDRMMVTRVPLYDGADTTVAQLFNSLLESLGIPRSSAHLFALFLVEDPSEYFSTSSQPSRLVNGPSSELTGGVQLKFYHRPLRLMQIWPVLRSFLFSSLAEGDAQTDPINTSTAETSETMPTVRIFFGRNRCATLELERANSALDYSVVQLLFRDAVRQYRACFLYPFDRRELFFYAALLLRATVADNVQVDERRLRAYLTDENLSYLFPIERLAAEQHRAKTIQRLLSAYKEVNSVVRSGNDPSREAEYRFLELCRNLTFYGCSFYDADLVACCNQTPATAQTSRSQSPIGSTGDPQQLTRVRVVVGVNDLGLHVLRRHDKLLYCSFRFSWCQFLYDPSVNAFAIEVFSRRTPVALPRDTESGDLSTASFFMSSSAPVWRNTSSSNDCDTRPIAVIEARQACLIYYLLIKLRNS